MITITRNFFSQSKRDQIVQLCIALFVFFSLLTFVTEKSLFPFVKFRMFAKPAEGPHLKIYLFFAVNDAGKEVLIKKNYFYPMTLGQMSKKIEYAKNSQLDSRVEMVFELAHNYYSEIKKIRLYEIECNCSDFFKKEDDESILDFTSKNCERKLYQERTYE